MKKTLFAAILVIFLNGCETLQEKNGLIQNFGELQISPALPNNYTVDNDGIYDYNRYEIEFTSDPPGMSVRWDRKDIGITPFKYYFTGKLAKGDTIIVKAAPRSPGLLPKTEILTGNFRIPRKVNFKMIK